MENKTKIKNEDAKIKSYYFTYGSSSRYPFEYGYSIVRATSLKQAIKIFRIVHPDVNEGTVNCSDYYDEPTFFNIYKKTPANITGLHEIINLQIITRESDNNIMLCPAEV